MTRRQWVLALACASSLAVVAAVAATPYGLGVTPDSLAYLHSAENLRRGQGFAVPGDDGTLEALTHFPPLYPATLALVSTLGTSPLEAARMVAVVLSALNVLTTALAVLVLTRSRLASTLAAFFVALSVDMLFLNTAVWSDAQFVFMETAALVCVTAYFLRPEPRVLWLGAVAAALALLGRYAAGALALTVVVALAALGPGSMRRRLATAARIGIVIVAPAAGWMIRNTLVTGAMTDRSLSFLGVQAEFAALVQTIGSWLFPGTNRLVVFPGQDGVVLLGLATAAAGLGWAGWRWIGPLRSRSQWVQVPVVFLLFAITYVATTLMAAALFDADIPLDNRILAPAYVAMVVVASFILQTAYRSTSSGLVRTGIATMVAGLFAMQAVVTTGAIVQFRRDGRGFVGPRWQYDTLEQPVADVDAGTAIFSNYAQAVEFRLGRRARDLSHAALTEAVARNGQAMIVYFEDARSYGPRSPGALKGALSSTEYLLDVLRDFAATEVATERNASVYMVRGRPPAP